MAVEYIQQRYRFRSDVLKILERAAKKNEHSVNAEIAARIDQSIQREQHWGVTYDAVVNAMAGGSAENAALLKMIASALQVLSAGQSDPANADTMMKFAGAVSELAMSHGGGRMKPLTEADLDAMTGNYRSGVFVADAILRNARMPPAIDPHLMDIIRGEDKADNPLLMAKLGKA